MGLWQRLTSLFKRPNGAGAGKSLGDHDLEKIPDDVAKFPLKRWDAGVFSQVSQR